MKRLFSLKDTSPRVKRSVFWSQNKRLLEYKHIPSQTLPLGSAALLSLVSRSADCSQHLC
nr:MAG TPA: hypothetical protein [Caudoviricetes sp.]